MSDRATLDPAAPPDSLPPDAIDQRPKANGHSAAAEEFHRPATGDQSMSVLAVGLALVALVAAAVGIAFGARAITEAASGGDGAGAVSSTVEISLTEFALTPDRVEVAEGGQLVVTNAGAVPHNVAIQGTELVTADLAAGVGETLDLTGLAPGEYALICDIPGHESAGMTGTLVILPAGANGGEARAPGHGSQAAAMTPEEMDHHMAQRTLAFPAATEGKGAQLLAPTALADGTKQFDLTTSIIEWEVEPGKLVEGWAYNGQIPGPTIKVDVGDKLRIVLHNELPESTAIHFHGVHTPNAMDGVPDITQAPVKPGQTFVYEFVAKDPAVGMYHSHHNAQVQVPNGLAGAILIGDVPLPAGVELASEHVMMLNDAGTIGYALNGKSFPATEPIGARLGEHVLVHYMNEGLMPHPMHLHGLDQLIVAKDGFPLAAPYYADTVNIAPGERYSVLIRAAEPGVWAFHCHILTHAESADGMFGMVTAMVVE